MASFFFFTEHLSSDAYTREMVAGSEERHKMRARAKKKKEGMKKLPREAVYTCERSGRMIHSLLPVSLLGDSKRKKKK